LKQFAFSISKLIRNLGRMYPHPWLAVIFLCLACAELVALAVHENSFWNNPTLGWFEKLALVVLSIMTWASVSWILWWITGLTLSSRVTPGRRRILLPLLVICCGILLLFISSSWVFYWRTSSFLDVESLQFGFSNLIMMGHYLWQAERVPLLVSSVACLLVAGLIVNIFRRLYRVSATTSSNWSHAKVGKLCLFLTIELAIVLIFISSMDKRKAIMSGLWWQHAGPGCDYEVKTRLNPLLTLTSQAALTLFSSEPVQGEIAAEDQGPERSTPYVVNETQKNSPERLSVIYIAVEALRSDVVFLEHQGQEVMPHLNRLARNGLDFTNCYAQSTHSDYADPCLFSSLYPLRSQIHHYYSSTDPWPKTMLYDVLKQHDYATAIYSSQNESWGHMDAFLESPQLDVMFDSRSYDGPTFIAEKDRSFAYYAQNSHVAGKLDDAITVEQAIEWIDKQEDDKQPFALCMNLQTSHFPYELPHDEPGPFQPGMIDFPASFVSYPREKVPVMRNAYFNALHYIDEQIGALVAYLEKHQLRDKTLIVIAGDQGEAFYENGFPTHAGIPYESSVRIALVMDCPGLLPAKKVNYLTQAIDIVPTICGLLQVPVHPGFQGIDVLAENRPPPDERCIFIHCESNIGKCEAVVTSAGWKLLHNRRTNATELFQLKNDPGEKTNVADLHPELTQKLSLLLQKWRRQQLLYYQNPSCYGFYYPPRTPGLSPEVKELVSAE